MAKKIDVPNQSATSMQNSESFQPYAPFIVQAIGAPVANFTIQQIPNQLDESTAGNWDTATGSIVVIDSMNPIAVVNFAYGFKYRIQKDATAQTTALDFYWGNTTNLSYIEAS